MRRVLTTVTVLVGLLAASPVHADIALSIDNGRVTLVAKDATVQQILAEWARVGQTQIVNAERLAGPPLTLEFTGVSEEMALGILLRSASGYLIAPKTERGANTSRFNRILIMPTSSAPPRLSPSPAPAPSPAPPPAFPQPQFPQPSFGQPPTQDEVQPEQEAPPVAPQSPTPTPRGPVFQTFPMPQNGQQPVLQQPATQNVPALAPTPSPTPVMPVGVATPGMPVPVPVPTPQPGQLAPQQPAPQPDRRPRF